MPKDSQSPSERRDTAPLDPTAYERQQPDRPRSPRSAERTELITDQGPPVLAWLVITSQGPRHGDLVRITGSSFLIGRANDCDLRLDDSHASRQHARIRVEGARDAPRFVLHDLATDNGTSVNGRRQTAVELNNGDVIRIGRTELTFKRLS